MIPSHHSPHLLLCNHPPTHPASPSSAAAGGLLGIGFLFTHLLMVVSPLATLTQLYLFFFSVITMTVESDGETVARTSRR